jgi:hypothetical protein
MDAIKGIRLLAGFLLVLTGIIHLALIVFSTGMEIAVMAIFGLLYVIIGIGLFFRKRFFIYSGLVVPMLGAFLGAYSYLVMKPEIITLFFISIDIAVILCCCYLLVKKIK